jgi:ABC-2 type transport system ATP-binding protein
MKQRLAIGASLIHRPPVLVLDEPTIGLDPNGARALRALLKDLCRNQGVTILYTTHYMLEAEELSDRLAIIHHGEKVIEGPPVEVRESLGDNRVVELQVGGNAGALAERLKGEKLVEEVLAVEPQPTFTTVRLRTAAPLASVRDVASLESFRDAEIRSVNLARPTLEDVFVSLTGSRITEAGDARSV